MVCQSPILKKSVSFSGKVRGRAALHINDYSEEEIQASWLNAADMRRIRGEIRYTIAMMNRGGTIDEDKYSRRGLEYRTNEGMLIRSDNRSVAANAVLNEQHRQEAGHFLDEEELARVYKYWSSRCQITAQLAAFSEEFNDFNRKLCPEISFSQTAPRRRILRRVLGAF
jgi:hypothetical protein